jgi:hypothetical protein
VAVEKHFEDFHDDQFDFHAYCIRKSTFRAYSDFLQWEDYLWGHDFYCTAAGEIIRIYLFLYDHPTNDREIHSNTEELSTMSSGERKKAKALARKMKKKLESVEVKENDKTTSQLSSTQKIDVDVDMDGHELVNRDPLDEAKRYVCTLVKNASKRQSTWILQYDVAIRRGKLFMALQALFKAKSRDDDNGDLFSRTVDFLQRFNTRVRTQYEEPVDEVLQKGVELLLGGKNISLNDFIRWEAMKISDNPSTSLSKRLSVSKSCYEYGIWSATEASSYLVDSRVDGHGTSFDVLCKSLLFLHELGTEASENMTKWKHEIDRRFPMVKDLAF